MQICTVALSFMERMPTNQALIISFFSEQLWHNYNLPYSPSFDIPFQLQYVCEIFVTWTYLLNDTNDFAVTKAARAFGLVTRRSWVLLMLGK